MALARAERMALARADDTSAGRISPKWTAAAGWVMLEHQPCGATAPAG